MISTVMVLVFAVIGHKADLGVMALGPAAGVGRPTFRISLLG